MLILVFMLYNINPLDQFEIRDITSLYLLDNTLLSLTNISLYLFLSGILTIIFLLNSNNNHVLVSSKWSLSLETIYDTINNIVINQINKDKGQQYFPFMYILFVFIL